MDAFCQRKYNSDFSREMTRSVEAYLRDYGLVRAEDGGEDGRPGAPERGGAGVSGCGRTVRRGGGARADSSAPGAPGAPDRGPET